ncbi:hypothetical protein DPM19_12210 [Actinomadura craniellae]|uniref:Right handed beta helix domain-containing protein n=2 Tax=Actinomadura craniellae TaxID=2231787 RepID=A0A365H756_9ACTN|nr:hypothetical protein DPM19_12210 [Actinomadura craniellae]
MAPGVYVGQFMTQITGTKEDPIFLCGTAAAVIDGEGIKKGYAFHLNGASYWRLVGFTVRNSQKGVMADGTTHSVFQGLRIHEIGDEALHLRTFSSDNLVVGNTIWNTGRRREKFGEGVYLGSAVSNWRNHTNNKPDKSDRNIVRGNRIRATAEAVDIKEGTSGGQIIGNIFDGSALSGDVNDSWVDVKGNGYLIEGNVGRKTPEDGFQTHQILKGWGINNTFRRNTAHLDGGRGVGIKLTSKPNRVTCDNKISGGRLTNGGCS